MESSSNVDTALAIAWAICGDVVDPKPQGVPVSDWLCPLVEAAAQYPHLPDTAPPFEDLPVYDGSYLGDPIIDPEQSFLQAGPLDHTQCDRQTAPPKYLQVKLRLIGVFDGKRIYGAPGDRIPPAVTARSSKKRKRVEVGGDMATYIKRPPNAFMLYRKEQRPVVMANHRIKDSAAVNTVIGQMWRALPEAEQAQYYQEAARLRETHSQLYPEWTASDNYGKKRKRDRKKSNHPHFPPSWRNPCFTPHAEV